MQSLLVISAKAQPKILREFNLISFLKFSLGGKKKKVRGGGDGGSSKSKSLNI